MSYILRKMSTYESKMSWLSRLLSSADEEDGGDENNEENNEASNDDNAEEDHAYDAHSIVLINITLIVCIFITYLIKRHR